MGTNHKRIKIGENNIIWKKLKKRKIYKEVLTMGENK